jgi:hypothetical protein
MSRRVASALSRRQVLQRAAASVTGLSLGLAGNMSGVPPVAAARVTPAAKGSDGPSIVRFLVRT